MTTHTNCTHPATKAGRAACRKAAATGTPIPTVAAAKAAAAEAPAPRRIKSVTWERVTCDRCGGTGRMPYTAWNGVCLKCNQSGKGDGTVLTRAGRAALDKYTAYLTEHHSVAMIDLQPGMIVRDDRGARRTVVSVDTEIKRAGSTRIGTEGTDSFVTYSNLQIIVRYKREAHHTGPYNRIVVPPTGEALQAAFRHVANMKGAIIEYAD